MAAHAKDKVCIGWAICSQIYTYIAIYWPWLLFQMLEVKLELFGLHYPLVSVGVVTTVGLDAGLTFIIPSHGTQSPLSYQWLGLYASALFSS